MQRRPTGVTSRGLCAAGVAVLVCLTVSAGCAARPGASASAHALGVPSASGAAGPSSSSDPTPSTLTVAVGGDFPTLDPAKAQDTESISAIQLLDEPLFGYDPQGQVVGRLASSWAWSVDQLHLTVELQPRATFADGDPVTADDVVFSLERMLALSTGTPHALSFSALVGFDALRAGHPGPDAGIMVAGPRAVTFSVTHPVPYLPELLAMPSTSVLERKLADTQAAASAGWWFNHAPGSGPYTPGASVPGTSLQLVANTRYWRRGAGVSGYPEGPYVSVLFRIISSPAQQLRQFAAGKLDVLSPVSPSQLAATAALPPGSKLLEAPALGLVYLGFNTQKPPFDNPLMRSAVAYAINKDAVLAAAGVRGGPAAGLVPPGLAGYDPSLQPYAYDPERARQLFLQAGGHAGTPITLLTIAAGGTLQQGLTDGAAASIQRDLTAVGFSVTLQKDSWQDYYRDLAAGRANMFQADWLADYPDPQDFFFNLLDSATIGASNAAQYDRPDFDHMLEQASETVDPVQRAQRYVQLDDLVYKDLPLLPEFYTDASVLVQPWVRPDPAAALDAYLRPPLMPQLDRMWLLPHGPGPSG